MSHPKEVPAQSPSGEFTIPCASPSHHALHNIYLHSPVITKRSRTLSQSERAMEGPSYEGTVTSFCRERGHGFVHPDGETEDIFLHISDIEEEIVPRKGDRVTFKTVLIPPKNTKMQAVHVHITAATPETHERWDESPRKPDAHGDK